MGLLFRGKTVSFSAINLTIVEMKRKTRVVLISEKPKLKLDNKYAKGAGATLQYKINGTLTSDSTS